MSVTPHPPSHYPSSLAQSATSPTEDQNRSLGVHPDDQPAVVESSPTGINLTADPITRPPSATPSVLDPDSIVRAFDREEVKRDIERIMNFLSDQRSKSVELARWTHIPAYTKESGQLDILEDCTRFLDASEATTKDPDTRQVVMEASYVLRSVIERGKYWDDPKRTKLRDLDEETRARLWVDPDAPHEELGEAVKSLKKLKVSTPPDTPITPLSDYQG